MVNQTASKFAIESIPIDAYHLNDKFDHEFSTVRQLIKQQLPCFPDNKTYPQNKT